MLFRLAVRRSVITCISTHVNEVYRVIVHAVFSLQHYQSSFGSSFGKGLFARLGSACLTGVHLFVSLVSRLAAVNANRIWNDDNVDDDVDGPNAHARFSGYKNINLSSDKHPRSIMHGLLLRLINKRSVLFALFHAFE